MKDKIPSWALVVWLDQEVVASLPLDGKSITIGRSSENTLPLPNSRLSKFHCRLWWDDGRLMIEDLGSSAGVLLEGGRIHKTELSAGHEFLLGRYRCRILLSPERGATPVDSAPVPAPTTSDKAPERVGEDSGLLARLTTLTSCIVGITDLQVVMERLVEHALALCKARHGYVVLVHLDDLSPIMAVRGSSSTDDDSFSRTVCRQALALGKVLIVDIALVRSKGDQSPSIKALHSGCILAIPLRAVECLGVLYLEIPDGDAHQLNSRMGLWEEVGAVGGRALRSALDCHQIILDREKYRWLAADPTMGIELTRSWPSVAMQKIVKVLQRVAEEEVTVLCMGESGTGKEVAARSIHAWSRRHQGPFVAINCGAIPRELIESELFGHEKGAFSGAANRQMGRLELVEGGTLLLDEIGELPLDMQVKLLRVLETRHFERLGGGKPTPWNARVIAATNRDLEEAVAARTFREDLFYRLNVLQIRLPPLRERREDIPQLAGDMLREANRRFRRKLSGITPEAVVALQQYHWPGNVRELKNVVERALVLETEDRITPQSLALWNLPAGKPLEQAIASRVTDTVPAKPLAEFLKMQEMDYILLILDRCGGNVNRAAETLQLARSALYKKLADFGIKPRLGRR